MAQCVSSTAIPCMDDRDPNKTFVCPYNKYHRITAMRYPLHVAGCRKMYAGDKYASCPFNARHEFPAVEYDYHISKCPDKGFIEREISSVPAPNVPSVNHFPEWDEPISTEDWDAEADQPSFSISGSATDGERTACDMIEDYQNELQNQAAVVPSRHVVNEDMSGLSKVQKKNLKRAQKRKEKRMTEEVNGEDEEEEENEMTAEQKKELLWQIAQEYAIPGKQSSDAFVDWVSILNQYCQKNKINQPKYGEAHNSLGGFGASVVVTTESFLSDTISRTKKEAKHSAARAALLGLNITVSAPDPCRAPHQRGGNVQRMRELEENRQLLEHNIQSNQQRIIPGLSQQTPSNQSSRQQSSIRPQSNSSGTNGEGLMMAGLNLNQGQNPDDEWQVVGRRPRDSGRVAGVPASNNALRLAGRGRGRGSIAR